MPRKPDAHAVLDIPQFRAALRHYADELPINTYWRYASGLLPGVIHFIVARPDLAQALAADAQVRAGAARHDPHAEHP